MLNSPDPAGAGGAVFPGRFEGGFIMAGVGMVIGSLLPTAGNRAHHGRARHAGAAH